MHYHFTYSHSNEDIKSFTPPWWNIIEEIESKHEGKDRIPCNWIDHTGHTTGTDIFVTEPYDLCHEDIEAIAALSHRYHLIPFITARSSHLPGRTVAVYLHATKETYDMLRIPEYRWEGFKELSGEQAVSLWHETAEPVSYFG